eukprot:6220623-Prymnesium_polylepis.1
MSTARANEWAHCIAVYETAGGRRTGTTRRRRAPSCLKRRHTVWGAGAGGTHQREGDDASQPLRRER